MTSGPEYQHVEKPLIDQLLSMGWQHTSGSDNESLLLGRENFRQVLLKDDLKSALPRINLNNDGQEWLDAGRIAQAVASLERIGDTRLLEANQNATELLLKGVPVDGVEGWDAGRQQTVHFIDWNHPEKNTFRVVNQFRVDEPGGQARGYVLPDLVLFVNGIPLVVIECKSPSENEPMHHAVDQLQRYANQRNWVEADEGNERLFWTNQFVVATCFEEARVGTFTGDVQHFMEWKDTSPVPSSEVAQSLGKTALSSQETLVAGMLRPSHLLDIVRHFTLFMEVGAQRVKAVCRYQQYRAVQRAMDRLKRGKTRTQDGEHDRRGGIVWHTQGSGKSLTMVFLVRKMRTDPDLRRFKVVFVTDRRDLQTQLSETMTLTEDVLNVVKPQRQGTRTVPAVQVLKETLSRPGSDVVFAMIQKYREQSEREEEEDGDEEAVRPDSGSEPFPVLNESEDILVMVDEAHRSHTNDLHANLMRALPNAARIGFTGTPILMGARKRTHEIFGDFIDRYRIKESEEDGATVPILYEGRTARAKVEGGQELDQLFENMLVDRTAEELEAIKRKYGTKGNVMESQAMIAAKARDMLNHYVANILPNGFKAQVVAVSRRAAIRYYQELSAARQELVGELEEVMEKLGELREEEIEELDPKQAFLARALRYLPLIRALEFAPIISGSHNDDPAWAEWTQRGKVEERIRRFKRRLGTEETEKESPLAFLIVKSMLLTGFDAPIEQVLYLDRHIKEAELLQAIARVNRTSGPHKRAGLVVDYFGVSDYLSEALAVYAKEDVEGTLRSLKDELPKLRDRHRRVMNVFLDRGIENLSDTESCVELLRDERLRAEFKVKLKQFLGTLDLVLPRPEGLPFVRDAKALSFIHDRARNRYREGSPPLGREVGAKVQKLIDDYIECLGIDPRVGPIEITDADFDRHVNRQASPKAKASEMEHALRYHIRKHLQEDPEHYDRLSRRLEQILQELEGRWDELVGALQRLVEEARAGRQEDETGLDPETQAPFFALLKEATAGQTEPDYGPTPMHDRGDGSGEQNHGNLARLCELTIEMVEHLKQEVSLVGFDRNTHAQETLRNWLVRFLDGENQFRYEVVPFERQQELAGRLLELAKAIRNKLIR